MRTLNPLPYAALRGSLAGLAATVTMSASMLALQKLGALGRLPPQIITDDALAAAGVRGKAPRSAEKALGTLAHFGFGAVAASIFELVRTQRARRRSIVARAFGAPTRKPPYALGVAYGGLVWTVSYMGWVPALGIMPPAHEDRPARPLAMILAHVVWGATLASALR
jgi:hypothetical protein